MFKVLDEPTNHLVGFLSNALTALMVRGGGGDHLLAVQPLLGQLHLHVVDRSAQPGRLLGPARQRRCLLAAEAVQTHGKAVETRKEEALSLASEAVQRHKVKALSSVETHKARAVS